MTPDQAWQIFAQLVAQTPALPHVVDQMREALAVLKPESPSEARD